MSTDTPPLCFEQLLKSDASAPLRPLAKNKRTNQPIKHADRAPPTHTASPISVDALWKRHQPRIMGQQMVEWIDPRLPAHLKGALLNGRLWSDQVTKDDWLGGHYVACDLHGQTETEALNHLQRYLAHLVAIDKKHTVGKIIHGKGHHSAERYPVLKNLSVAFLQQLPHCLGYASTLRPLGGAGATLFVCSKSC